MIDKIIIKHLASNKRLVIPEFGAFIRKDTGEVVFVEFLKKDDGVLNALVRDSYLISDHEAKVLIQEFVVDVKKQVAENGGYAVAGLGSIRRDDSGVYYLDYDPTLTASDMPTGPVAEKPVPDATGKTVAATAPTTPAPATAPAQPESRPGFKDTPSQYGTTDRTVRPAAAAAPVSPGRRQVTEYGGAPARPANNARQYTDTREGAARPYSSSGPASRPAPPQGRTQQNPPQRPAAPQQRTKPKRSKMDTFMIVAIIVALMALGAIIYGLAIDNNPVKSLQPTAPATEQSPVDVTETPQEGQQ